MCCWDWLTFGKHNNARQTASSYSALRLQIKHVLLVWYKHWKTTIKNITYCKSDSVVRRTMDGYYSLFCVVFQDPFAADKRNNYISRFIEMSQSKVEPALGSFDNDQRDAHFLCFLFFTIRPLQSSTCFKHYMLIIRRLSALMQHLVSSSQSVAIRCTGWERTAYIDVSWC